MAQPRPSRPLFRPRALATGATAALCVALAGPAAHAAAPSTDRVPISAARELVPSGAVDEGVAPASGGLDLRVYLRGRDPDGLERLAARVSDPDDPEYGRFLDADTFAERFAPTAGQVGDVTGWLRDAGLTVTATTPHYVAASGPAAAVQRALDVSVHSYRAQGRTVRAPAGAMTVPAALRDDVLAVTGASDLRPTVRPASSHPVPVSAAASTCSTAYGDTPATQVPPAYGRVQPWRVCGYLPAQLRGAYGVTGGLTGAGTRVAVVAAYASETMPADVRTFAAQHGEPAWADGQLTQSVPAGLPAQPTAWGMEEVMDVEAVHAIAPGAKVVYVASAGTSDDDFVDALQRIVDGRLADVVSNSWVIGADTGVPDQTRRAFRQVFLQGAVQGIGFLFASGDTGSKAASDDGNGPPVTAASFPASDPWVTAVGGTTLAVTAAGGYGWETGWETDYASLSADGTGWVDPPGTFAGGSGGGASAVFPRPVYQLLARTGSTRRVVPDVAMEADPVTGMLVGQTLALPSGSVYVQYASGGTSLAAPLFAGIQALAQQHARHRLGFANPVIYARPGAFRDVTDTPAGVPTPIAAIHVLTNVSPTGEVTATPVLATFGRAADAGLVTRKGFDTVTGLGSPTPAYFTTIR